MAEFTLKDLLVPVEDYASVTREASILEGILALKAAQKREFLADPERHRDRAVLVKDKQGEIIGKLSMWSIIGCLEPAYGRGRMRGVFSRLGRAGAMIGDAMDSSHRWRRRLRTIAEVTARMRVGDLLHEFRENELIDENDNLEGAMHQLVTGHFMSLLVTREGHIVGILRLVDVFEAVSLMIGGEDGPSVPKDSAGTP